jgi:hypothetical protein
LKPRSTWDPRLLRLATLGLLGAVVGFAVVIYLFATFLAWLHG